MSLSLSHYYTVQYSTVPTKLSTTSKHYYNNGNGMNQWFFQVDLVKLLATTFENERFHLKYFNE